MRKLITIRFQRIFIYDNLLHRGELAGHFRILAVNCRGDVAHSDETQSGTFRHGTASDYLYSAAGGHHRLSLSVNFICKRRAERARAMWPSTAKWLADLKACKHIFAEENSSVAASLFKLCERRRIAGVKVINCN